MAAITQVVWMPAAEEDFRQILSELYDLSGHYASVWAGELERKLERLKSQPLSGRIVPEKELSFFREIFVGRYRVMYCVMPEIIYVMRIRHMSGTLRNL
jgi:toxin ParE1/3/4